MWKYNALLTGPQAVWQPLTDNEDWVTMEPGSLWLFHDGEVVSHRATQPSPIKSISGV
jgi:Glutamine amidotransferases class-II